MIVYIGGVVHSLPWWHLQRCLERVAVDGSPGNPETQLPLYQIVIEHFKILIEEYSPCFILHKT